MFAASEKQYGPLDCVIIDGGGKPDVLVVMCHGYGASGTDLVSLSADWIRILDDVADRFRFVFPAAPLTLEELGMPGGRAWWPLNTARLLEFVEAKRFDELHSKVPPGLDDARQKLCDSISAAQQDGLGDSAQLVLGGFSQGAMLTMDTSMRGSIDAPSILIQFSGTVVCEPLWQDSMSRLSDSFVYQSHGTTDPILPFSSAQRLHEMIEGTARTEFHSFVGPHTIDPVSLRATAQAMRALVSK